TDSYNPNCREARTLLTHLHDPGYINKTMGPKFLAKVEEVKKLLTDAEGFYQSGRYDLAMKRYDQVLNLDPYNTAARKGQERIDVTKFQYGVQGYNETRGRAMWQVEHGWEQPVRQYGTGVGPIEAAVASGTPAVTPGPPSLPPVNPAAARITLTLNQIPLGEALRYIASQAGLKVKVEPFAVLILPLSEQSNELTTKEYRVPPGFIGSTVNVGVSTLSQGAYKTAPGATATGTGKDTQETTGGQLLVNREGAREFLESQGVPFPAGASAHFLPQSSRLIVRNTIDNLELVDALVEQANVSGPKQVQIESK